MNEISIGHDTIIIVRFAPDDRTITLSMQTRRSKTAKHPNIAALVLRQAMRYR